MGFVKVGDNMPVINYVDDDGIIVCPDCQEPFITIAIDENDNIETVCKCKHPEVEQLDA
jgi:hypothetical protein